MSTLRKNFFYVMLFAFLAIMPVGSSLFANTQPTFATAQYSDNVAQVQTQNASFGIYYGGRGWRHGGWGGGWNRPYYGGYYYPYYRPYYYYPHYYSPYYYYRPYYYYY